MYNTPTTFLYEFVVRGTMKTAGAPTATFAEMERTMYRVSRPHRSDFTTVEDRTANTEI